MFRGIPSRFRTFTRVGLFGASFVTFSYLAKNFLSIQSLAEENNKDFFPGAQEPFLHLPSRKEQITSLKSKEFDVLVIGGGATGTGIALDATTRGLKVALVGNN